MFSLKRFNGKWLRPGREAPQVTDCPVLQDSAQQHDGEGTSTDRGAEGRLVEDYSSEELHFIVDYVGSAQISEAQSVTLLLETIKKVKRQQVRSLRVDFSIRDGVLKVSCVDSNSLVLTAPLYAVALCAHEQLRGFESTFGCNITRKGTHMSHVFQAGNQYEAASIVRTLAFSFKTIGKMIREKRLRHVHRQRNSTSNSSSERTRTNSEVSTTSTVDEYGRDSRRWKAGMVENVYGKKSAHAKVTSKQFSKSSASPSILRHPASLHTSGRHVEFSALSPVPSDGSDSDGRDKVMRHDDPSQVADDQRVVEVEVYSVPLALREVGTVDVADAGRTKTGLEIPSAVQAQRTSSTQPHLREGLEADARDVVSPKTKQSFPITSVHSHDIIHDSFGLPEQALLPGQNEDIESVVNAILKNDRALVEKFLDDGVSVNSSDRSCRTLLHHAVAAGKADMVHMLLQRGALVNCEGPEDKSPLHIAAAEGNRAVTQLLLANGANVRAKDNTFCTPLHMSVRHQSNLEVSHLLIEHGARIYENNIQGKRPLDLDPTLKEMQRLLVQSACEAFVAADGPKSRSSSNASSTIQWSASSSFRSRSSAGSFRQGSALQHRRSSSLCSIASMKGPGNRAKAAIHRSESIHLARTLSPLLGNTKKATLIRSRSLQRPPSNLRRDFAAAPEQERPEPAVVSMATDAPAAVASNARGGSGTATSTSQGHLAANTETGADTHADAPDEPGALPRGGQGMARPGADVEGSAGHDHAQVVQSGLSECEDNSLLSTGSHVIHDDDVLSEALGAVVLLSGNPECHPSLLAHLCLPKASAQLVALAHMHDEGSVVANHLALLIGNLFNLEGPDSRKRSVESGLIRTVLELVNSIEPVQSTCLSILHNILDFDNDREYSTALNNIPLDPLLSLLQASDADSGACDMRPPDSPPPPPPGRGDRQRRRKRSSCSQSSFDDKPREMSPVPGVGQQSSSVQRHNSGASDGRSHNRSSVCSVAGSAEEHAVPFYCPGFGHTHLPGLGPVLGLGPDLQAKALPKLVATKMLAATSVHPKMRRELGKIRPLSLLLEASADRNVEIAIYATAALANSAAGLEVHTQMLAAGCPEALKQLLNHGDPWVRYHAARGLIYLGHVNVDKIYLFKRIPGDGKLDVVFADTSEDERLYVRGATVEKIVEILSNNPYLLWGGLNLPVSSPHLCRDRKSLGRAQSATEEQIIDFLLTVFQSFVHPVILLRLLIHRFHDPWFDKYFDGDPSTGQMEQFGPLPLTHIHLMRLWKAWLEHYPEDFVNNDSMASELSDLVIPMRQAGGPYLPCADSLEDLICHLMEKASAKNSNPTQENHLHHNTLYEKCKKAVLSEQLFCSVEDAIYLAALQLYVEDLSPSRGRTWFQSGGRDKVTASRIKQVLSPSVQKERNIAKRIKALHEQFSVGGMSERSAKHIYIDCCQNFASYGCKFFKLKESLGTISRTSGSIRRLLCINPKKIVLLDDKTKATVGVWQFKELKRWTSLENDTKLRVEFVNLSFEFLLEEKSIFKQITEVIFSCTRANFNVLAEQDFSPWSKYAEETEVWGPRALDAEASKPGLGLRYDSDSSTGPRGRATSFVASSVSGHPQQRFHRQCSMVSRFSTSAPYPQGNMAVADPTNLIGRDTEFGSPGVTGSPPVRGSPSGPHNSEERLLESVHSTPASPRWWPASSFSTASGSLLWSAGRTEPELDEHGYPTESSPLYTGTGAQAEQGTSTPPQAGASFRTEAERDIAGLSQRAMFSGVVPHGDVQSINSQFLLSPRGQLLVCHCPPDAEMPGFDRLNFTVFDLLQHPKELARQLALIDHEFYRAVTAEDLQKKIAMGTGKKGKHRTEPKLTVERVADRFNQLSTWVVASILTEDSVERRAQMFVNFIETAKLCLELRNFNAVMAIVVAALGSAPIRRLHRTKELIPKEFLEQFAKMEILMDTRNNYKRYRETLRSSPTPTVPYFGIFMKDLTFIAEGNPDYLKGGLINLTKRRQVYLVIEQVRHFQKKRYNFQEVPEVHQYLLEQEIHTEEELHKISRQLEPGLPRRYSESGSGPASNRACARRKLSLNRISTAVPPNRR